MSHASTCHAALLSKNAEIVRVLIEYQAQAKLVRQRVLRKRGTSGRHHGVVRPRLRARGCQTHRSRRVACPFHSQVRLGRLFVPDCDKFKIFERHTPHRPSTTKPLGSDNKRDPRSSERMSVRRASVPRTRACLSLSWVRVVSARKLLRAHSISHHRSAGNRTKRRGGRAKAP